MDSSITVTDKMSCFQKELTNYRNPITNTECYTSTRRYLLNSTGVRNISTNILKVLQSFSLQPLLRMRQRSVRVLKEALAVNVKIINEGYGTV